jgi:putative transposase
MYNRQSTRLKKYDYSKIGLYFITINIQDKLCLFGKIRNSKMIMNKSGYMVEKIYQELTNRFQNIKLHEYVIMPNHMHCIIEITNEYNDTNSVGAGLVPALKRKQMPAHNTIPPHPTVSVNGNENRVDRENADFGIKRATTRVAPTVSYGNTTVGGIIGAFKSLTTIEYIKMVKNNIVRPFDGKLWQKRFYDHII